MSSLEHPTKAVFKRCVYRTGKRPIPMSLDEVDTCYLCSSEFSWYWRWKHLCPGCGFVYCSDCIDNLVIPYELLGTVTNDLQKICNYCLRIQYEPKNTSYEDIFFPEQALSIVKPTTFISATPQATPRATPRVTPKNSPRAAAIKKTLPSKNTISKDSRDSKDSNNSNDSKSLKSSPSKSKQQSQEVDTTKSHQIEKELEKEVENKVDNEARDEQLLKDVVTDEIATRVTNSENTTTSISTSTSTPTSTSTTNTNTETPSPSSTLSRRTSERLRSSSLRGTLSRSQAGKISLAMASAIESGQVDEHGIPILDPSLFEISGLDDVANNSARSRLMSRRTKETVAVAGGGAAGDTTTSTPTPMVSRRASLLASRSSSAAAAAATTTTDTPTVTNSEKIRGYIQNGKTAGRLVPVDLFNSIWAANSPIVIDIRSKEEYNINHIPRAINIPLTLNDINDNGGNDGNDNNNNTKEVLMTTLKSLEQRINSDDMRQFRMRRMRQVCIYDDSSIRESILLKSTGLTKAKQLSRFTIDGDDVDADADVDIKMDEVEMKIDAADTTTDDTAHKIPTRPRSNTTTNHTLLKNDLLPCIAQYTYESSKLVYFLAGLLLEENLVTNVDILSGGIQSFQKHYPKVMCVPTTITTNHCMVAGDAITSVVVDVDVGVGANVDADVGAGAGANANANASTEENTPSSITTTTHTHMNRFPGFPSEIIDRAIYLGTEVDSHQRGQLEKLGITHILNASRENENHFDGDIVYLQIHIDDEQTQPISTYFNEAFSFLDRVLESGDDVDGKAQNNRVLVHCQMGVSRSATLVIAYIMRLYKCSLRDAIAMVRSRRSQVLPNVGFLQQLGDYEKELLPNQPSTYEECVKVLYPTRPRVVVAPTSST